MRWRPEAEVEEAVYTAEALERGQPFKCPCWYIGDNDHPLRVSTRCEPAPSRRCACTRTTVSFRGRR
jgi:hypothetical protein